LEIGPERVNAPWITPANGSRVFYELALMPRLDRGIVRFIFACEFARNIVEQLYIIHRKQTNPCGLGGTGETCGTIPTANRE
jgi:hypothetical protein